MRENVRHLTEGLVREMGEERVVRVSDLKRCRICGKKFTFGKLGQHYLEHKAKGELTPTEKGGGGDGDGMHSKLSFADELREQRAELELLKLRRQRELWSGGNDGNSSLVADLMRENTSLVRELGNLQIAELRREIESLKGYVHRGGDRELDIVEVKGKLDLVSKGMDKFSNSIEKISTGPIGQAVAKKWLREGGEPPQLRRYSPGEMKKMSERLESFEDDEVKELHHYSDEQKQAMIDEIEKMGVSTDEKKEMLNGVEQLPTKKRKVIE